MHTPLHAVALLPSLLCLSVAAAATPAVESVELRDGRLMVNGRLFLPIGIYHAAHWHKALPEAAAKGFNLVQTYGRTPEAARQDIDEAFAHGLYAGVALNGLCEQPELVEAIVQRCQDAPGLLCWGLEDEPNIRLPEPQDTSYAERPFRLPPATLRPVYDLIRRLDPKHPVWLNLAHGWLRDHRAYASVADIHSDDIYPVPEVALPAVAAYADVVRQATPGKVPWLVLQMAPVRPQFGDRDRHPTMAEVRCMTYMALAHGMTGLWYCSFNERPGRDWRASESDPAYWAQWADLTAELSALRPWLLAPQVPGDIGVEVVDGPAGKGPWDYPALHLSLRRTDSGLFLIAANGLDQPLRARLTLPVDAGVRQAAVRSENRLVELAGAVLDDRFERYAVHLYELPRAVGTTTGGN
jgi:hypothetical protein